MIILQAKYSQVNCSYLYKPFVPLPGLSQHFQALIEVRVAREYLSKQNKALRERNFWGNDVYTSDSDVVCILQHNNYILPDLPPTDIAGLSVFLRVSRGRSNYQSSLRNGIRSRKLGAFDGSSIKLDSYNVLSSLGTLEELIEMASRTKEGPPMAFRKSKPISTKHVVAPPETEIIFNISCEPAYKFSLASFADYGCDSSQRTSNILHLNVLYFEANSRRYEIAKEPGSSKPETFRLSEVLEPFPKDNDFMSHNSVPLTGNHTKELIKGVNWTDFKWTETNSLIIKSIIINNIINFQYFPIQSK